MLKVNPSEKKTTTKTTYGAKHMSKQKTYVKTEDHIELRFCFNSRYPRHRFWAQRKMQHLRISWRNPCSLRLDFCLIIKSCSCFWMVHKSKQVYSLVNRFMMSEGSDMMILPFISKLRQSVVQNRQNIFFLIWVLLVKRGHILAFYRPNFRLQT